MFSDLTSGIPLDDANPLLGELYRPSMEAEEKHRRDMDDWRFRQIQTVDRAALDPDGFYADKPLEFHPDQQAARRAVTVRSYLTLANDGKPVTGDLYPELFRQRIAAERFDGRGADSDAEFHAEIQKEAQGRKDASVLMQDASTAASTAAILTTAGEPGMAYDTWIAEARNRPGYRRDFEDVYFSEWHARQRDLKERMAPVRDLIASQWTAMKEGKAADLGALEGYMGDEESRETLLFAIGGLVKALPKDQQPGVMANLRKQFLRRDLPLQTEGVMRSMRPMDRDEPLPEEYLDQLEPGYDLEKFNKAKRTEFERDTKLRDRFVRKLESIVNDEYDPIVTFAKEGSNLAAFEKGLYAVPGVATTVATAMVPGAGNFISYEILRKTSTDMARDSLVKGGFTEDQADDAAEGIGTVSALIQLPMERLGLAAVTNRLPFVKKAIGKLTTNLATRYLARAGSSTVIEFGTEMGQDLVPSIVQEIGAAAGLDMPGVQFTGEGGVFHHYDKQSLEVLGAILPLSLIMAGGGVSGDLRIRQAAQTDDLTLRAAGMSPEAVAALRAANGIGQQEDALRAGWESRDITSPDAVAAQEELTARTQAEQEVAAEASRTGVMPTFYRSADGWSVRDGESGAEIGTASSPAGALRLAMAHSDAIEADNADQIAALGSLLDSAEVVSSTDREGTRQTATDLRPGQVVTTSQQAAVSEADDLRVRQQLEARERLGGGDGGTARMVLGQSVTETRQKVRNTVNRINAGGSVLTVFHEETHGFFREALATGRLTREDTLAAIRSIETVLAGKATKEGDKLVFLSDPDTFAGLSQQDQDAELDEAVAELMEAEILRTRKTAGRSGTAGRQLPPGLITRNLTAMARLAPGAAAKLRDFIAAVRAFWGLTFARASAIRAAIREGKLSEAELDAFKAKLFALDEQDDLEQQARDTEARILDGELPSNPRQLDGNPFSLASRPSITEDDAPAFSIAGPRAKGFQAAKDAGRTFTGRDGKERFELNTSQALLDPSNIQEAAKLNGWSALSRKLGLEDVPFRWLLETHPDQTVALGKILHFPDLFANYPQLQTLPVSLGKLEAGTRAQYSPRQPNSVLGPIPESITVAQNANAREGLSYLLHELQHAIQEREGFARGGNPEQFAAERSRLRARMNGIEKSEEYQSSLPTVDRLWNEFWENDAATEEEARKLDDYILKEHATFRELRQIMTQLQEIDDLTVSDLTRYRALPGEIEARGVQARASMTAEQRAASPFMESFASFSLSPNRDLLKPRIEGIGYDSESLVSKDAPFETFERDYVTSSGKIFRFIKRNEAGEIISGLGIKTNGKRSRKAVIQAIYTEPEERRKGHAASLLRYAEKSFDIKHSSDLTDEGRAFKKADGISYSLGPAALADLLGKDAISRIKDPVRRAQAMSRIAREMEAARLQFERLELIAGSKRLKKSLAREAAIRTALRREELENEAWARHWQILSDDDLVKIKQQPAHKLLSDPKNPLRGRIQSRTETIRRNPELYSFKDPAEYNGSEAVSRSVFGGSLTPDLAVEELIQEGLLRPGSKPDEMWQLLEAEARSVSDRKRDLDVAKQELREARTQATDETNVWLREQGVVQETTFGDKQEILRALGVLDGILSAVPAEIRGKIGGYTQLARIATNEAKLAFLKERLAKVDKELEKYLRDQFDREFRDLLEKARPEEDEAGKKPRGKIGADVHELFSTIRESMTMTSQDVEARAVLLEEYVSQGIEQPNGTFIQLTAAEQSHATLEANLIRLAGNWAKADAARREAALIEATSIYEAGYMAHKIQTLQKREKRQKIRDALQTATGKAGTREERRGKQQKDETTKAGRALTTLFSLMSFEQVVERAFGPDTQEARDLVDWERHAAHAKTDAVQNKLDALDDLFSSLAGGKLKGEQLRFAMSQPSAITVDGQTFSELEAITATLMWRQEDGQRHMTGHVDDQGAPAGDWNYTQSFIDELESKLSTNAKAVRLHLAEQYAAEYDRLNAVFRDLNGVSLPRHKAYSPLTVKPVQSAGGQMLDPVTGMAMSGAGFTPGSLKNRSQSAIAEPDFRDALQVYIGHAKQMEHWIAYAPFATEAMAILNTRDLGNSVEAAAGKEALSVLRSWLDVFAQGGTRDAAAHLGLNKLLGRVTGRAAATALVGRVSVLAIQSTQLGAALAEMPTASYISRLARLFAGRLDWSGALASDYIQRRKAQMPPIVQQAMEGLTSSKPSRLKYAVRKMGETISGADALFTAGTFAIVLDYQTKQAKALGLTGTAARAYALEAAERSTDRVAQPVRPGTRSLYEVTAVNPLARISWSFASDARQKLALSAYALANKPPAAKARALAVTWIAGGVVASLIRAAMRDIRDDGEDDEIFDAKNWDPTRLALAALTGPLAGIPALGDAAEGMLFGLFGEYLPEGNLISGVSNAGKQASKIPDWLDGDRSGLDAALQDAEALMSGVGLFSDSAAAVTSLLHVARDLFRIGQNVTD